VEEIEINQYLSHIKNIRRYSSHTITAYRTDLKQFSRFYGKNLLTVAQKDVRGYLLFLKTQGYSFRSINRKLEVLRSFYRYYRRFTDYQNYPCAHITPLRYVKPRGSYLTVEVIKDVLDGIRTEVNRKNVRDRLVLELLYQTGCRANEIINLRKDDIDFLRRQIKVLGKGKIERIIPMRKKLMQLIRKHLGLWEMKNQTPYLITNNKGKKIYPMFLWRLIRSYFNMDGVSAHTLRHSFATHLYHNRAPIKAIRDLLGHQSLRSTTAYLHLDIFQLSKIYTNSHPRTQSVRELRDGLCRICEPPRANEEKRSESREQEVGCEH
jgi:integrase/recombinase XerC